MVLDHFWGIAWGYVTVMVDELYHGDVPIIYRGLTIKKIWWLIYQTLGYNRGELTHRETANAWRMTLSLSGVSDQLSQTDREPLRSKFSCTGLAQGRDEDPKQHCQRLCEIVRQRTIISRGTKQVYVGGMFKYAELGGHLQKSRSSTEEIHWRRLAWRLAALSRPFGSNQPIFGLKSHRWWFWGWFMIGSTTLPPSIGWLVVWNMNFIFPCHMGCHPSHWLIFFRWVGQPPTRSSSHD